MARVIDVSTRNGAAPEESARLPSVFEAFRPIERYERLIAANSDGCHAAATKIEPLDALLMYLMTAYYPATPTVVDLAADATAGASSAFWAQHPGTRRVIVPRAPVAANGFDWRAHFTEFADELAFEAKNVSLSDEAISQPTIWRALGRSVGRRSPVFFTLAVPGGTEAQLAERLERIFDFRPDAVVLLTPLGFIGESAVLEHALAFCALDSPYRLTALRELAPFFADSRLGLIVRSDNTSMHVVLDRIRQLYDGNFQFLQLAHTVTAFTMREKRLEERERGWEERERAWEEREREREEQRAEREREREEQRAEREEYAAWLESRLQHLEEEYIPWKNEYIGNLESLLRDITSGKMVRVSGLAGRILRAAKHRARLGA